MITFPRVLLCNIDKIEFGLPEQSFSFGRSNMRNEHSVRLWYRMPSEDASAADSGYFHMFRSTNLRFFNNMAVVVRTEDEQVESLKAIADSVGVAMEWAGHKPDMWFGKLDKRKSKVPDLVGGGGATRPGSRAVFSNVTSQISKLNPIGKLKFTRRSNNPEMSEEPSASGVTFHKDDASTPTVNIAQEHQ